MLFFNEIKRSEIIDFGIPEDKKFPLDSIEHVKSAIKLFGHAEESKKKSLAKRIAAKAKEYNIEIPETTQVYKYLKEDAAVDEDMQDIFNNIIHTSQWCSMDDSAFCYINLFKKPMVIDTNTFVFAVGLVDRGNIIDEVIETLNRNNDSGRWSIDYYDKNEKRYLACHILKREIKALKENTIMESAETDKFKKVYDITMNMFKDSGRLPNTSKADRESFLKTGKAKDFNGSLCIAGLGTGYEGTCSKINKEIKQYGAKIHPDNYGTAILSFKKQYLSEETETENFYKKLKSELSKNDDDEDLEIPDIRDSVDRRTVVEILDDTDLKHIYLTSDWHIFKNRYKKEANYVNTQKIISWCKKNIKSDDVFMYLGDMSYRWIGDEDKEEVKKIFKSLPGIKILIIGNHDEFSDGGDYQDYGFRYAMQQLQWQNYIFTHKPIAMENKPGLKNIHGHMHKWREYNTTDGKNNVNVYPSYFNNKPVTLDYVINNFENLTKGNKRSNWNGMGESSQKISIDDEAIQESSDLINDYLNKSQTSVDEWSMAACNPVIGITKPFILKATNDCGSLINSKLYALSPDIVSDKYIMVDENCKLSIVDRSYFDNCIIEIYKYNGNAFNVSKIKKAYDEQQTVSLNYIYEALTGKDLLSSDQIDFDENFEKINLEALIEKTRSNTATMIEQYNENTDNYQSISFPVLESTIDINKKWGDRLDLRKDINGYYLKNILTEQRTRSVRSTDYITEAMVESIY